MRRLQAYQETDCLNSPKSYPSQEWFQLGASFLEAQMSKLNTKLEITLGDLLILRKIVATCPFRHRPTNIDGDGKQYWGDAKTVKQVNDTMLPSSQEIAHALELIDSHASEVN